MTWTRAGLAFLFGLVFGSVFNFMTAQEAIAFCLVASVLICMLFEIL